MRRFAPCVLLFLLQKQVLVHLTVSGAFPAAPCWVIALKHGSEFLGVIVDTPALIGTGHEFAMVVPAIHPAHAVVQLEEAHFAKSAMLVLDSAGEFAALILGFEEVAAEDARVFDRARFF